MKKRPGSAHHSTGGGYAASEGSSTFLTESSVGGLTLSRPSTAASTNNRKVKTPSPSTESIKPPSSHPHGLLRSDPHPSQQQRHSGTSTALNHQQQWDPRVATVDDFIQREEEHNCVDSDPAQDVLRKLREELRDDTDEGLHSRLQKGSRTVRPASAALHPHSRPAGAIKRVPSASVISKVARPSSALSRTTTLVDEEAGSLWKQYEHVEEEEWAHRKKEDDRWLSPSAGSPTTPDQGRNGRRSPTTKGERAVSPRVKKMTWAQMMTGCKESSHDPQYRAQAKEQSTSTWERLWKTRGMSAPSVVAVYSPKRQGASTMQRVSALREDPEARRALDAQVTERLEQARQEEIGKRGNIRKRNVATVKKYASYFAAAKRATAALRRESCIESAKVKREGLQSWRTARAVDALQKADFLNKQRAHELEFELLSNTWATFVFAAVSLCEIHDRTVDRLRMMHSPSLRRYTHPGAVLQQNFHTRKAIRMARAARVVWKWWERLRYRVRRKRSRGAILLVFRFLKDIGESVKIPIAIRKKLRYVRMLQQKYRFQQQALQFRSALCGCQLEKALKRLHEEDEQSIQKMKSAHRQYEREINAKRGIHRLAKNEMIAENRDSADKQVAFLLRRQHTIDALRRDLKIDLVRDFLTKKRTDYNNQVYRYGVALKNFYAEQHRREEQRRDSLQTHRGDQGVTLHKPFKPHMTALFTKEEVTKLVNNAMDRMLALKKIEEQRAEYAAAEKKEGEGKSEGAKKSVSAGRKRVSLSLSQGLKP